MKCSRFLLVALLLFLAGCTVFNKYIAAINSPEIPSSFTGIDRDLWSEFVRLTNLPDCELPCWWGLEVGETDMATTIEFLEQTEFNRFQERRTNNDMSDEVYINLEGYSLDFTGRGDSEIGDIDFFFSFDEQNILHSISLTWRDPKLWLPDEHNPFVISKLFTEINLEPIVLVVAPEYGDLSRYPFFIVYPETGVELWYTFNFREYPELCLSSTNTLNIDITITSVPESLVQAGEVIIPIEDEFGLTAETFIEFFREHPNECLDIRDYE